MTVDLAIEYIPRRMCELGYGSSYSLRFRHLRLEPGEVRIEPAYSQLIILVEPPGDVRVESNTGLFDLSEDLSNELQYEHQGEIIITNLSASSGHLRFIQVIPKNFNYASDK